MKKLIDDIKRMEHGFKHIIVAGNEVLNDKKVNHFEIASELLKDESYQARMLATYLLGQLSKYDPRALNILETKVANYKKWRVQKMLAKGFDYHCSAKGYRESLPIIKKWLSDPESNVKRAVIEGLRIWTSRPYFKENPIVAIQLISLPKSDESEYLRKSIGNALRDIGKTYKSLVETEIKNWDLRDEKLKYIHKLINK